MTNVIPGTISGLRSAKICQGRSDTQPGFVRISSKRGPRPPGLPRAVRDRQDRRSCDAKKEGFKDCEERAVQDRQDRRSCDEIKGGHPGSGPSWTARGGPDSLGPRESPFFVAGPAVPAVPDRRPVLRRGKSRPGTAADRPARGPGPPRPGPLWHAQDCHLQDRPKPDRRGPPRDRRGTADRTIRREPPALPRRRLRTVRASQARPGVPTGGPRAVRGRPKKQDYPTPRTYPPTLLFMATRRECAATPTTSITK